MGTLLDRGLIVLILLGPTLVALAIRRRIPHRPTLGAWLVVGSIAVAVVASFLALQWRHDRQRYRDLVRAIAAIDPIQCTKPPPADGAWRTLHEIQCAPDHLVAYLEGTGEHRRLFVAVRARGDRLVATWMPTQSPATGKAYRVWLEDRSGKVVDTIRPSPSMLTVIERPGLASAVKLVATLDATDATAPGSAVVAEAVLRPAK